MLDGIWRFLPAQQLSHFQAFLISYTKIRLAEGVRSDQASQYCSLPQGPRGDPLAAHWAIRSRSFEALLHLLRQQGKAAAKILDLGAGVGWLSHRLCSAGFQPCAIDILIDARDGLAAARHYELSWPRLQAEFDHLPIASDQADAAIFNASFHYSGDYVKTLREAFRVLRPGGLLVIMDSPVYRSLASGRTMRAEQHADFERRFGDRSDSLGNVGFLTWQMLEELGSMLQVSWSHRTPWYGWRWAARPLLSRLKGRREPATFTLIWTRAPA